MEEKVTQEQSVMAEDKKNITAKTTASTAQPYKVKTKRPVRGGERKFQRRKDRDRRKSNDPFETRIISIRRVTNVKQGGKNMSLSVMVAVGDKKGRVGVATAKGKDVRAAQEKAIRKAKKRLLFVQRKGNTIPHEVTKKFGSALVMIKPAAAGTGVIAGGTVRSIVELAGIEDIVTKIIGTKNNITNAHCTVEALRMLRNARI